MIPLRQIEAADLLVNANDFSTNYVSAILAGTPQAELVTPQKPNRLKRMGRSHCPCAARAFTIARSDIANPRFVRPRSPPPHRRKGISPDADHQRRSGTT